MILENIREKEALLERIRNMITSAKVIQALGFINLLIKMSGG